MKRRRAEESADGLALMTSSVTSSYSADDLRKQSQESAAIAKRCRLYKLIRQRFALALKIQQEDFALLTSRKIQSRATVDPVARFIQSTRYDGSSHELQCYCSSSRLGTQMQEKKKQAKYRDSTSPKISSRKI
ncbi:transposon protein Ac/Ds sub-class [Dorcoceras hygrometricum]|uniref:Transposon protein Ac/Ds sub-class n=1 Tax=Dorcoceras hygrometricum TaxID=472368 RepID=A0A2Z7C3K1_9LAMI|nr:transposon protein Ac/Ds sub-class [Dorcoceras hygrometricum]